ncbi:MAG: nitroreductase family protein [Acidobacteriota bacterium]
MDLNKIIVSRRTVRQFKPESLPRNILEEIVNSGRLAPSASNLQPLEFLVIDDHKVASKIFSFLKWAAYIQPEGNPKPGNEPPAYIIILVNRKIREKGYEREVGAAAENMILAAWSKGIASCWLISVEREKARKTLKVPEFYLIDSVIALGYPAESPVIEDFKESIKYWKDEQGTLHVPKRKLEKVIHFNRF